MNRDSEPIRVLRVIARLNVGGPALHVAYLSEGLRDRGYETMLVAGTVGEGEGSMEAVARSRGVEPVFVPTLQREVSPVEDVVSARTLRKLIRAFRPHVLHTHTAKAGAVGRLAALIAGEARPPVVVHTFHGHVLRGYFGGAATEAFRRLERQLARATDALIAVSPEVRNDLVQLGIAPAAKVAVVRLGLDLDARLHTSPDAGDELRRRLGIPDDHFLVGWLGRMTAIKRVDDLLTAFAAVHGSQGGADLLLVGDGPLRGELEDHAARLGISDRCHFTGYRDDVAEIYAACDVIALSSANEGTPVTVIEALAAGCPVVSTDVGGVRDVVRDGIDGYLAAPGDTPGLAAGLAALAHDPERARAMGATARERVVATYSVPRLVDDVDRLYRSLLQVKAPRVRRVVGRLSEPLTPALPTTMRRLRPAQRRLRVLMLSQYFPPEVGATQSRMQTFAEHLAARGHRVTVVAEFPNHPHGIVPEKYRGRLVVDDRSNEYRVLRVWVKTGPVKNQASRLELYLSYTAMALAAAPIAGRADVVLATSPPLFSGIAGVAIARANGAPLVLDVRDLWPAAAVSLQQISGRSVEWLGFGLERWLYRQAAAVTTVTLPFSRHVDRLRPGRPGSALIPNGTLGQFFAVDGGDAASRELLGRPNRFLVTFAGTHGIAQALPRIIDAAALLQDTADFAFVGEGPVKDALIARAESLGLENVRFLPQVPLDSINPVLGASDALLVPLSGHPTFAEFVPSKMIDFMAAGKPILLSARGEAARILALAGAGVPVTPEDPEALATAVRGLASDPAAAAAMGERGRLFAARRLRSQQAERLEQVLLDVAR
ncbi:MAG TPA: glycosyltransferase [Gaiellaceae bacterium]|nr:glycosyltransferase [Gaiellaceae bacterium]